MKMLVPYNYVGVGPNGYQYRYAGTTLEELYLQYGFGYTDHPYKYFVSSHWIVVL